MNASWPPESASDLLLDHIEAPYHKGRLQNPSCTRTERNPHCGDQVQLQLRIEEARVAEAWFEGRGCVMSQAAASLLCELIHGRSLASVRVLQAQDVLASLGVQISPVRRRCVLLAWKALQGLLTEQASSGKPPVNG